ncbi:MAG TPA: helix-turn-helix domain-containing protein [Gemmatimonadaceae bacterium]|jgi:DNA-binding HxlR family transcriptional regulator|nr:helix-turn-helix domain-containing protein [Gemmatimonadaceae bacterium]
MTRRSRHHPRRSGCPIAITLDVLGDQWSLLVVRDLMFHGRRTFGEFAAAGEGVATNVLAERLERLEAAGIIARAHDPADRRRKIYGLTSKGLDLAPVLVEIVLWAARHEPTDAPPALVARMRRDRAGFLDELRRAAGTTSAPDHPSRQTRRVEGRRTRIDR